MAALDLVGRLFSMVRNRDGQARALEATAFRAAESDPAPSPISDPERSLQEAVATKLLEGWLSNRNQTLVPHTLNFAALLPEQTSLLVAVMAAAAQADGQVSATEARQIPLALGRLGAGDGVARQLEEALQVPQPLSNLLARAQKANLATHAYAAALLAIERRSRPNRAFLHYLGARLGLSPEVASSLERRYRT